MKKISVTLTPKDVQKFFEHYYVPSNLAIAIVGDVNPAEVKKLAQTYFGRYQAKHKSRCAISGGTATNTNAGSDFADYLLNPGIWKVIIVQRLLIQIMPFMKSLAVY